MFKKLLVVAGLLMMLITLFAIVPQGKAYAMANFSCSNSCNGQNPQNTVCVRDAATLGYPAYVYDQDNVLLIEVESRYSQNCGMLWTRITNYNGWNIGGSVTRPDGLHYTNLFNGGNVYWTPMVYAVNSGSIKSCGTTGGTVTPTQRYGACIYN